MSRWDKGKKKTSYFKEWLLSKRSINGGLGAVAAGVMLSIPFGFGIATLPVLAYVTGMGIASLFVPGSSKFREQVDRRNATKQREAARDQLLKEIARRVGNKHDYWRIYDRLTGRRDSLRKVAERNDTAVTQEDVDRLDDATLDFLGLWLGRIVVHERLNSIDGDAVRSRIEHIGARIEEVDDMGDKRRLMKAKRDLEGLLQRREEMLTREAAMEAQMLSMSDTFDEVYQRVMANPGSRARVDEGLAMAVERMDAEEELDYILDHEVEALLEM